MVSNRRLSTFHPLICSRYYPSCCRQGCSWACFAAESDAESLIPPPLPPTRGLCGNEGQTEVTCLPATYPAPMFLLLKLISFRNASPCNFLVNHALWTLLNKMAPRVPEPPTRVSYLRGNKRTLLPQGHFLWPLKLGGSGLKLTMCSVNDSTE